METATRSSLHHHLRRLLTAAAFLPRRLLSFVALKELFITLSFLLRGLRPRTIILSPTTYLRLWSPSRPSQKPSLLLVHGFGGNAKWQWHSQIGPLSRSFDLYVPDLVFFGGSRSGCQDRSVLFQASCVAEAMRKIGVDRYAVVGISYGGFVAYNMAAAAAAGEVEKAVIMTAGVCSTAEERRELAAREGRDPCEILLPQRPEDLMALLRRSMYRPPKWMPRFLLRDVIEMMYKDNRKERAELLRELMSGQSDPSSLPVLNQETLILWGDRDNVFPLSMAYQLHRHLGSKSRLEVIKDAGHALQLEKPSHVNYLIEQFLLDTNVTKST